MRNKVLICLAAVMLLSACRSHKTDTTVTKPVVQGETVQKWQNGDIATTTGRVTMSYGGRRATLNARVRLKRNDVVQVQFSYSMIITIQVGCMELTKDEFLFLDRINRQYSKAPYAEADGFLNRHIDFESVQTMFWGDNEGGNPSRLQLALPVAGKMLKADFTFDEWGKEEGWPTRTTFNEQRFAKVSLEQLVQTMINM